MKKYFLLLFAISCIVPSAFAQVTIKNDQQYVGDDGAFHVVGEVQNNLDSPLSQVNVFVTLYDENDNVIVTKDTRSLVNIIMPEMKGPFDFIFTDIKQEQVKSYSLDLDYSISEPKGQAIDITSSELSRDSFKNLIISGTVENRGDITANTLAVVVTIYDRNGNVAAVSRIHPEPDYLGSDDDTFFVVSVLDKNQISDISDYTIVAESEEYVAAPEFPIGSLILLAGSVSAYIGITRSSSRIITNLISATNPK
ncbi:MAG TPA: FxLYD domain-containing protein [Nitrosopumilaceae archaeon]|nr:FxLYD domain-containing protein [Nitrosopumilaceae archaeon]